MSHHVCNRNRTTLTIAIVIALLMAAPLAQAQLINLYNFTGYTDDANPIGLTMDNTGNLYGVYLGTGYGQVFELRQTNSGWLYHPLYNFADGYWPLAGLIRDAAGNLYGATNGGGNEIACNPGGCGTVFQLDANGNKTVLHAFNDGTDGAYPAATLFQDSAGNLYGTTTAGGDQNCPLFGGCGVVFEITP